MTDDGSDDSPLYGRRTATTVLVAVVTALVVSAAVPASAAPANATTQATAQPSLVVQLQEDGSARVAVTLTYDLETDDEQAAFGTLRNDSDARTDARDRFRSRMASVAGDASDATGRDMSVTDAAIDLAVSDDGSVGVVELSVTWTNLAATRDGSLVVTEPFASGFEPDRRFTVRGPDGYGLASASPSDDDTAANAATWSAGADLSGFETTFEPTSGGSDGAAGGDGSGGVGAPGFGVGLALVALAAAALALARRR